MRTTNKNRLNFLILLIFSLTIPLMATGPRVSTNFLTLDENEIYALDIPPFISTEVSGGGAISEIVNAAFSEEKMSIAITTVPLQSMIKYYFTQEKALAIMGRNLGVSEKDKKSLISIPLYIASENYLYYKPLHPKGLEFKGELLNLKGLTYGASKGEDTSSYKNKNIKVKKGRALSLFKKLKKGTIDFISMPSLSRQWFLEKHHSKDKNNFTVMEGISKTVAIKLYFNLNHSKGKEFSDSFKKGLRSIVQNGKYASILKKHIKNSSDVKLQLKFMDEFLSR